MTERFMFVGMIVFYAIMMVICLWCLWCIYKAVLEIIRETIIDFEEGKYEEKTEEIMRSGETEGRAVVPGSNGGYAEEEEKRK